NLLEHVADVLHSGTWSWPNECNIRFLILNHEGLVELGLADIEDKEDQVVWKTREGN
ncbi:hypothetical protein Tco_0552516, partial [Tanacetum coccineum]